MLYAIETRQRISRKPFLAIIYKIWSRDTTIPKYTVEYSSLYWTLLMERILRNSTTVSVRKTKKWIWLIFNLAKCQALTCLSHLRRHHLSSEKLTEHQLILTRAGHFDVSDAQIKELFVCPSHRGRLGKYWSTPKTACQYPLHKGKSQSTKSGRVLNVQLSKDILDVFHILIPVGSRMLRR